MMSTLILILVLCGCWSSLHSLKFDERSYNFLRLSDDEDGTCDEWTDRFSRNQRTVSSKIPPDLRGKWVSESCEVRPGPQFLIRKYIFHHNNSFETHQFYYADDSCTTPSYSITASGKYRFSAPSWVVPGGMNAEYLLTKVLITPYSNEMADSLSHKVNTSCPGSVGKLWRPYRSYKVYSYIEVLKGSHENSVQVIEDMDCISGVHVVLHELQLVRVEHRKPLHRHSRAPGRHISNHGERSELFLGDIHTEANQRSSYHPTSYQTPLLRPETSACHVCHVVAKSSEKSPPQLNAKVKLPVYLSGVWISHRCETRPYGMFITRRLSFYGYNQTWRGEYQYHSDPKCMVPTFKIEARGQYRPGNPSMRVHGGTDYNFYVQRAAITPHSPTMVDNLNGHRYNSCGKTGAWQLNKMQDVTATKGCIGLGLKVPATEFDIVRMEIDHHGNAVLDLGHVDTNNKQARLHDSHPGHSSVKRPTSYQTSLLQCKTYPSYADNLHNTIYPEPYQDNHKVNGANNHCFSSTAYFFSLLAFAFKLCNSGHF